jgi:DNA-binding NarL/FixJ family response regulator
MATSLFSVIVADEQPLLRNALCRSLLDIVPDAVLTEVDSLALLRHTAERYPAALVLLNLAIPGMDGLASVRTLRADFPDLRIALICGAPSTLRVRAAQALGAVGYLYKSTPAAQMQEVLRRLVDGGSWWPIPPARAQEGTPEERLERLSPQEMRVLLLLRDGGRNRQIADNLAISESTVKSHISAILYKLGLYSRTQAALMAQRLLAASDAAG